MNKKEIKQGDKFYWKINSNVNCDIFEKEQSHFYVTTDGTLIPKSFVFDPEEEQKYLQQKEIEDYNYFWTEKRIDQFSLLLADSFPAGPSRRIIKKSIKDVIKNLTETKID